MYLKNVIYFGRIGNDLTDAGGSVSVEMVSLATVALEAAVGINTSSVGTSSVDQVALIDIDWMSIRSG